MDDGQITFNSSDIDKSKAGTKPNYFVNLRRSSAIDKLSQKIDQKKFYDEVEAKKRAEAEAIEKENAKKAAALSADRFTKKEAEIKVPTFVKMQGGSAPAQAPVAKPVTPKPIQEPPRPQPIMQPQPTPPPEPPKPPKEINKKALYITGAAIAFVAAAALIVWSLIPKQITVTKETAVAKPSTEKTILDEITTKRIEIIDTFESEGAEAGLQAYADYLATFTDSETLALVHSWRAIDLYNLYRGEYKDTILQDAYTAEELNPTKGTATLIYSFEHEFGDAEKSKTYYDLASARKDTPAPAVKSEAE